MTNSNLTTKAEEILKAAKFNCTKAQVLLLKELLISDKPLSREELIQHMGQKCPDTVTVYRILERFCERGLVHKVYLQSRAWKYELGHNCTTKQCHPHFTCSDCGETFCLTGSSLPLIKDLKKGFVIHRQQVNIDGLCPACS
ncbi:MAG: transcriptional repressor [Anaerohalosphaera sp.]|nr:transcriptional repressor [Anaerohalosphaera sp.]